MFLYGSHPYWSGSTSGVEREREREREVITAKELTLQRVLLLPGEHLALSFNLPNFFFKVGRDWSRKGILLNLKYGRGRQRLKKKSRTKND